MGETLTVDIEFDSPTDAGGDVLVRPMRDELAEYQLVAQWLTDDRVLEWVYGRDNAWPLERLLPKYRPRVRRESEVRVCLVEHRGVPVGLIQYYPIQDSDHLAGYGLSQDVDAWGIDMWIGDPAWWGRGLGPQALRLVVDYLWARNDVHRLVIDPRVDNPRAIRAYEKAGFQKVRVLPQHEFHEGKPRDAWLMEMRTGGGSFSV